MMFVIHKARKQRKALGLSWKLLGREVSEAQIAIHL
jgi:hypothetical protein